MKVKDYFKLRPVGFHDEDVWVCENRYNTKSRSVKKIKQFWNESEHIKLTYRETPIKQTRVMSVFKALGDGSPSKTSQFFVDESLFAGAMVDYDSGMMAVPAELDMDDEDASYDEQMIAPDMEINDNLTDSLKKDSVKRSLVKSSKPESGQDASNDCGEKDCEDEDEDGVPAPITIAKRKKDMTKNDKINDAISEKVFSHNRINRLDKVNS
jgi:prolyl oligopeptidase PreP (S9A serine peptidase family)